MVRSIRREPGAAELALNKYAGDPAIVARHVAWGAGRAWPVDTVFEQKAAKHFCLPADKVVGVLACGTGGAAIDLVTRISTFVHGYDWRDEVEKPAAEIIKKSGHGAKVLVNLMSLDTVFPPKTRCHGMIAVEPVLTRAQPKVLDWLRLAVVPGSQIIFEEPSLEHQEKANKVSWFHGVEPKDCFWQSPSDRENALKQSGFAVQRIQETTGGAMRSLHQALQNAQVSEQQLDDAIKLAPVLEPVRNFFKKEVNSARNRLQALEVGDVAVYRYRVIKPCADR